MNDETGSEDTRQGQDLTYLARYVVRCFPARTQLRAELIGHADAPDIDEGVKIDSAEGSVSVNTT